MSDYQTEKNISILLIEDNMGDAILIQEFLLESIRFRAGLTHCMSIKESLQQLESANPDIILLDLSLPDAQDLSGLHKLRDHGVTTPIIVLTGRKDEIALESLQSGAQDYLTKDMMMSAMLERSILYTLERSLVQKHLYEEEQKRLALENQIEHERLITSLINDIYHEFRNPLSVINTSAAIMARKYPDEKMTKHQHRIENNVARLLEIIEYMAQMTRLSDAQYPPEPVNLTTILTKLSQEFMKEPRITFEFPMSPGYINIPEEYINKVLQEILDNALIFSDPDSPILVICEHSQSNVLITIKDHGLGIAHEDIENIVLPFYKVDGARTQYKSSGAGLGLTIANMIAQTYAGEMNFLSGLNEGTKVVLKFPLVSP